MNLFVECPTLSVESDLDLYIVGLLELYSALTKPACRGLPSPLYIGWSHFP